MELNTATTRFRTLPAAFMMACVLLALAAAPAIAEPVASSEELDDPSTLAALSLEQLMNIEVTSVAGVEMEWFETPSAMYVITQEDIRRTGHQSLPELLRIVPGMHVGRLGSHTWSVTSRGFGGIFSNKLQVLIDGRSVYDPFFSGVYWDIQHVLLEDVDRIEVVRGPGATLWGANAVNGVINVNTQSAEDTQGWYLSGLAGTFLEGMGAFRYGDEIGDNTWYRVWGTYRDYDSVEDAQTGEDFHDDWYMANTGFRLDHEGADDVLLTLQGGVSGSDDIGEHILEPDPLGLPLARSAVVSRARVTSAHVLGRMTQKYADDGQWSLQAYVDHNDRASLNNVDTESTTFDVEWRHHFHIGERNEFIWGLGYRGSQTEAEPHPIVNFDPAERDLHTYSAFIQDTITLAPDKLFAMVGSKFEYNSYTDFEYQPSARLSWTPTDRQTLWGSVSRAVRTPSRVDSDVVLLYGYLPFPAPFDRAFFQGSDDLESEELWAYELGYRQKVTDRLAVDVATFFNQYDDVIALTSDTLVFTNQGEARSVGAEVAAEWRVADNWRLNFGYSYIHVYAETADVEDHIGDVPMHQARVLSYFDITDDLEFNSALYFTDRVEQWDVPSYLRLDLGLTWRATENLEIAVWGQNLLEEGHVEYDEPWINPAQADVPRSFYVQATLRF